MQTMSLDQLIPFFPPPPAVAEVLLNTGRSVPPRKEDLCLFSAVPLEEDIGWLSFQADSGKVNPAVARLNFLLF